MLLILPRQLSRTFRVLRWHQAESRQGPTVLNTTCHQSNRRRRRSDDDQHSFQQQWQRKLQSEIKFNIRCGLQICTPVCLGGHCQAKWRDQTHCDRKRKTRPCGNFYQCGNMDVFTLREISSLSASLRRDVMNGTRSKSHSPAKLTT